MDSALIEMADTEQYTELEREQLEVLCLDLVEECLTTKLRSAKGKRKGKVKQGFILKQKKKAGRKMKGAPPYTTKMVKEEEGKGEAGVHTQTEKKGRQENER